MNWLYPYRCGVCRVFCEGAICPECQGQWKPITDPYCLWCGRPFEPSAKASPLCGMCLMGRYRFDGTRSAVYYEGVGRETVHALKFRRKPLLAKPMGEAMVKVLERVLDEREKPKAWSFPDLIVPVPLHPRTRRNRGYNQAELLAKFVGDAFALPVRPELLRQVRLIRPQASLGEKERWENVKGAFTVTDPEAIQGRIVLVVDDVMTTGATLHEIAKVLREAKARRVYCLTFARTVPF